MPAFSLGGQPFIIKEPVFRDLKNILSALNRLNNPTDSDFDLVADIQLILVSLLGEHHVNRFKHFWWQVWKLPPPNTTEITALLAAIPDICGLQQHSTGGSYSSSNQSTDWDALYWRVIRQTGWTWEIVDTTMTVSRLSALSESLNNAPAVESLVAAYLGYEYSRPRTLEEEIEAYLATQPT
jgi:hypothetical protein